MLDLAAAMFLQSAAPAPETRTFDPYLLCVCHEVDPKTIVRFSGYVDNAELLLGPDGHSVLDRQATIFNGVKSDKDLGEKVKVWHPIKPEKCGLAFDYGAHYKIVATRVGDKLETNACLMGKVKPRVKPSE